MDKNTLERLNNLQKQIEQTQDYRDRLQKLYNVCSTNNRKYTFEFGIVESAEIPDALKYRVKELVQMVGLNFNLETEVFITLVLKKLDDKLSELREEFENG